MYLQPLFDLFITRTEASKIITWPRKDCLSSYCVLKLSPIFHYFSLNLIKHKLKFLYYYIYSVNITKNGYFSTEQEQK